MRIILREAFGHHAWATATLIKVCTGLRAEQLATAAPGTYGPIEATLRHIVEGDAFDLYVVSGGQVPLEEVGALDLRSLGALAEAQGRLWLEVIEAAANADSAVREVDPDDGYTRDASLALRLAAALQHGESHRTQVCAALTTLGIEPPKLGVLDYGMERGAVTEAYPPGHERHDAGAWKRMQDSLGTR